MEIKKVYIWGAGKYAELLYSVIDKSKCNILGVIDSDSNKHGIEWKQNIYILSPGVLTGNKFDYVLISSMKYQDIENRCKDMNIPDEKIGVFCKEICGTDIFLSPLKMSFELEKLKRKIENMPYELEIEKIPQIKSAEALLELVLKEKCSVSRFGDGEFELMFNNQRSWFQKTDRILAERLKEIIVSNDKKVVVAIAKNFGSLDSYTEDAAEGIREYMSLLTRTKIMQYIDLDRTYYDAYVARPYMIYKDKTTGNRIFSLFKKIFEGRNIIIVEGHLSKFGVQNDLLSDCKSVRRVECPQKNGWSNYEEILQCVKSNYQKDDLICISMGPTATVLAYDLGILGMQSIDIGQLDNEYEWYLRNASERIDIPGKMVAEVKFSLENKDEIHELEDENYKKQIIAYIGCE